jgi:transcriptional regulator GlxA family with amidase domain
MALLPDVVHVDAARSGAAAWLEPTFALLRHEADRSVPGAQAIFAKLADVFLAQALREFLLGAQKTGLLALDPIRDGQIDQALALIHDTPKHGWTVDQLARKVGMSRTAFAVRFRTVVGEPPMRHLAKLRLSHAAGYLATSNLSVASIARRSGYDSAASLSKAFTREYGMSPGRYRKDGGGSTVSEFSVGARHGETTQ